MMTSALYMKPSVTYDQLYEIYDSDLTTGDWGREPGDQFEVHMENIIMQR